MAERWNGRSLEWYGTTLADSVVAASTTCCRSRRSGRSRSTNVHVHFSTQFFTQAVFLDFEIVSSLQVEPESVAGPEEPGESKRCIRGDSAPAVHDPIDAARRNADVFSHAVPAYAHGGQELLQQNLARMARGEFLSHQFSPSGSLAELGDLAAIRPRPKEKRWVSPFSRPPLDQSWPRNLSLDCLAPNDGLRWRGSGRTSLIPVVRAAAHTSPQLTKY